ncbi:MAG: NUDIX domain-containing protein [Acidimicrobiia bacterium]|nr:NUDIX domain-containing protein [Acidimicrobiia bacterium]
MPQVSAGILLYRLSPTRVEVLLGHPGGPFWANRQDGAWSIPKGLVGPEETALDAARREFTEETGQGIEAVEAIDLGTTVQRSGKLVHAWAVLGDLDTLRATSNPVRMEWPRGSGRFIEFPEIDELRWCGIPEATRLLNPAQTVFLDRLTKHLDHGK